VRVLLVEDDEPVATSLRRGLVRYGFEVEWVATGAEALHALPAELVLLDLGLPESTGSTCAGCWGRAARCRSS
jgi:two-component system response regulator RegX3